jgi:membrane protein implicated in regulation of membrane protease activity
MEFLLLWVDELDDAIGALRHLAPQILGFLAATAMFVATGAAVVLAPQVTLAVAAIVSCVSLLEVARRRRTRTADQRDSR